MNPFGYQRPRDPWAAVGTMQALHRGAPALTLPGDPSGASFLAGGTKLIDLMKAGVMRPAALVARLSDFSNAPGLGHLPAQG